MYYWKTIFSFLSLVAKVVQEQEQKLNCEVVLAVKPYVDHNAEVFCSS